MATTTHAERAASGEHRVDGDRLYRLLHAEVSDAGCLRPAPVQSAVHGALVLLGYAAAYTALLTGPGTAIRVLALAALAFLCVQAGFIAHEAGHGAITRHRRVRAAIGHVFNTLLTALCFSYFRHIHRRHHPHCNDRGRDPDMQSSFFSMYPESARTKRGLGKLISRHQSFLIWILVSLQPFTLKLDSMQFLWRNPQSTRVDQIFLALHFMLWLAVPAAILGPPAALLNYASMSLLTGPYLGVIFLVNHIGTRIIEPHDSISFFMQEVSTTRNLGSSRLHDVFFGGVNNHIEHHLFPSVPTARLRTARTITRAFCRRHGVPYREMSWRAAAREVTQHFRAMSAFVPRS
jgi:fatty acid desaturase